IAVAVLKKTLTEHENAMRAHLREQLLPGDRQQGAIMPLSLDAAPGKVGYALLTEGSQSWRVTDPGVLLAWVKEATPGEVVVREEVRPAFVTALLKECKEHGGWLIQDTGEVVDVPGIECKTGDPVLQVRPHEDAHRLITEAWASGALTWNDLVLEIEAAPGDVA
ncbi:MAG TPA: hypothetical protein VNJ04_19310, partial [Gemmatimonadaceae bacterium]|nr:hypothetical protein [Gemmatimonadaceae bacterium]